MRRRRWFSLTAVVALAAIGWVLAWIYIIGGEVVDEEDWSALLIEDCTGILIGPNVLITAAHCVDGTVPYLPTSTCDEPSNSYVCPDHTDIALCLHEDDMSSHKPFEVVSGDASWTASSNPVTLLGFGLPYFGTLRKGTTQVHGPSGDQGCFELRGKAAACGGDSGGGAFVEDNGKPRLVGIMSDGACWFWGKTEVVDLTSGPGAEFIQDWVTANPEARICGIHTGVQDCR